MTTVAIDAVAFCAQYSRHGDWAFDFALRLARAHHRRLNIFDFLANPYGAGYPTGERIEPALRERLIVERERELRLHYDSRLGDYLDVGFRLCEDDQWTELHRCLCRREFQVLVLAYPRYDAVFAGRPLVEFADSFVCPVVLVGPSSREEFYLNRPAALLEDKLDLEGVPWDRLEMARAVI
jgi:hypothetical protein